MQKIVQLSVALICTPLIVSCERWELDQKLEELCKRDGGIRVNEAVTLPKSYFEPSGPLSLGPTLALGLNAPESKSFMRRIGDDEYRYITTRTIVVGRADADLEGGGGSLTRISEVIVRQADTRLLGEYVWYRRDGGDGFTFGAQPSVKLCPDARISLTGSIFIKGE